MTWVHVQNFQQHTQYTASTVASTAVTLGSAVAVGDTILVGCTVDYDPAANTAGCNGAVTDQLGNTYTKILAANGGQLSETTTHQGQEVFVCIVTVAGTPTITYSPDLGINPHAWVSINGDHLTGSDAASTVRASAGAVQATPGTGANAVSSGSVAASSGDLLWGAVQNPDHATASGGTGFTASTLDATAGTLTEWKTATGAAAVTFTDATNGTTDHYLTVGIAITPAAGGTTPTPAPGKSLNEARARFKTRSRLAQLREHGHAWFRAIVPAVPLRNTTLVPAKWIELSSRIGATIIQRATTGVTSIVVAGRTASTKRVERAILTRGRFFNKNGVAMRVPTGTPATWLLSNSVIGSATIQRPTTGVTSALFTQRDHTEHPLQRRLRSSGAVTARTWLPPPPSVVPVKIHRYVFLRRPRDEFIKARRLRPTTVIAKTGLPVIRALGWVPKAPAMLVLRKEHDQRAHVAHQRPHLVAVPAPLPAPPVLPAKKAANFVFLRRIRDQQLHVQRRATVVSYDTTFLVLPSTTPTALPGTRGWQGDARVVGAHRVHLRHDRASVTTRQLGAPTSPAPGNIRRIAFFILGRERAERRLRATVADRGRLFAHTWLPAPIPVVPPLPIPKVVVVQGRAAGDHRSRVRRGEHHLTARTWLRIPPPPPVQLPKGLILTARTDRARQAHLRHEKARFTGVTWIPLRLPPLLTPPPRLRLGQIVDGRVAGDRRIRLLRDQAHVRSWRYVTTPLGRILTGTLHLEPVFTATSLAVTGALDATLAIQPPE